jgi:hypothetical protein
MNANSTSDNTTHRHPERMRHPERSRSSGEAKDLPFIVTIGPTAKFEVLYV